MGSPSIEFLIGSEYHGIQVENSFTLQKSMLLTPLLPNAGPTGGLGLA